MKYKFGEKIRAVREKKNMTMKEVAEKAGVTESLISQIERNKVSPAIDTLLSIIDILEIDLEYIFSDFKKEHEVTVVKSTERVRHLYENVIFEQLANTGMNDSAHCIEAYYMEISPGGEKGDHEYGHMGKELGVIIEGKGEFTIGTKKYFLEKGDSISFKSDVPHVLKNTSSRSLKAFWVITPPKGLTNK